MPVRPTTPNAPTRPTTTTNRPTAPTTPAQPQRPQGWAPAAPRRPTGTSSVNLNPPPPPASTLRTPALAADPTLAQVAAGRTELASGARGPSVKLVQEALVKAGFQLPRFGADGDFGNETTTALRRFQQQSNLPSTGRLDAKTIAALDVAGPNSAQDVRFPRYDELFKDGVMRTTIAVGYDEHGAHLGPLRDVVEGLNTRGFQQVDVRGMNDDQLRAAGLDPARTDRDGTYFVKDFKHDGKDVKAVVRLITPDTPGAKDRFANAMRDDEVVIYSGHGRYGSGPDFDHKTSAAGNYVIGTPTSNAVALGQNDVRGQGAMGNQYQLVFFDGCNTYRYLDEMRSLPRNKNAGNLDIMATNTELPWSTSGPDVLAMMDGLTGGKSVNHIQQELDRVNGHVAGQPSKFRPDGFQDN
jgi:hypothetical protein